MPDVCAVGEVQLTGPSILLEKQDVTLSTSSPWECRFKMHLSASVSFAVVRVSVWLLQDQPELSNLTASQLTADPLLVVVQHDNQVESWKVPFPVETDEGELYEFNKTARTIQ